MPRCLRYSPNGSIGRRNLPCSTVKAHTENSIGARFWSRISASSRVAESLPPESATATRSPSRIILKRCIASPTFRSSVFSRSTNLIIVWDRPPGLSATSAPQVLVEELDRPLPRKLGGLLVVARRRIVVEAVIRAFVHV